MCLYHFLFSTIRLVERVLCIFLLVPCFSPPETTSSVITRDQLATLINGFVFFVFFSEHSVLYIVLENIHPWLPSHSCLVLRLLLFFLPNLGCYYMQVKIHSGSSLNQHYLRPVFAPVTVQRVQYRRDGRYKSRKSQSFLSRSRWGMTSKSVIAV